MIYTVKRLLNSRNITPFKHPLLYPYLAAIDLLYEGEMFECLQRKPACCSMSKPLDSKYVLSCSEINFSNIFEIHDKTEIGIYSM
jgi:hypothetical protein